MPDITDQLKEILEGSDPADVAKAIKEASQPVYQAIFDKGHSTAVAAKSEDLKVLQDEKESLQSTVSSLQSDLKELKSNTPDLDKWREEKEAALQRKESEWKEKYTNLQDQYHGEKQEAVRAGVVQQLTARGLDEWTAKKAVDGGSLSKRVKVQDGDLKFYQQDGQTPLAVDSREEALNVLAGDFFNEVPKALRKGPSQEFGGAGNGESRSAADLTDEEIRAMSDDEYKKYRKEILSGTAG